ncbi:MAG: T9SS type A sorting domain-containing protein, partial [Chitinophagales bacterium]
TVPGLAAGTYYIRVLGQDGRSGYTLTNTITPPVYANDLEPNNDFASASNILSTDTVTGHIDFRYNGGIFDNYDYWQSNNCLPGDITASVTDDNGKYVYLYLYNSSFGLITSNSGYGGASVSALTQPAGTYYFVVYATDGATSYQLTTNLASSTPPLTVSLSATGSTCGMSNGSINATPSGGTTPYSYSWSNGATTQDINGLSGGTYTITVMDANGCSAMKSISVSQTTAIALSETHTNVLCNGDANGSIDLTVAGAVAPYSYSWSNGANTQDISGLTAGTYTVTVNDQSVCSASLSVTITQPGAISISQTITSPLCNGDNNGAVDVTVTGGSTPYSYSWSNGAITHDLTGIGAGSYTVTVTDNNGCSKNKTISVSEPAVLSATETHMDVTTNGGSDGSINVTVSGGTTPYSYNWSNGASSQDLNNLSAGTYSLTVTDAHGCTASLIVIINEPGCNLSLSTTKTNVSCAGANDGSIDLTVSGGTAPYTYSWSDGASTQDRNNLGAGTYTVTVNDAGNCSNTTSATITEPMPLIASETHTNVTTNGGSDGSIDVTVTGGTTPYTYTWSNGTSTQDLNNLTAGTYILTITDAHGCKTSLSVTITEPGNACNLVVTTTHTEVSCAGNSDGTIALNVMNAQEPVTYTWSDGGPNSAIRTDLSAGNYDVVITDANGCSANASITIGVISVPAVSIESYDSGTECDMGKISFMISEGEAPYTIQLYQDGMPYGTPVITSDPEYAFTDLGNGEYYASVYSSGAGTECASNSGNAIIMPIPQNLTVVDITATSGLVTWTPLPCMEQYRVYYRATGDPENTIMIKVDDNSGMLLLTGLKPNTKFKVKIQSVDLTDWKNVSKQSVTAKFKTLPMRLADQAAISAKLTVFPNPATSSVNVSFMNGSEGEVSITLLDVTGRILLAQQKIEVSGMVTEELDLSAMSAGVYQLVIISADGIRMNQSIVKVKE